MKRDVVQLEWNVMAFQDVPDRKAERRPGKLNQREYVGYIYEEIKYSKVGKRAAPSG